jgi:anti-anti-sigma factor
MILFTMPPAPEDYSVRELDGGVTVVDLHTQSLLGILDVNRVGAELTALITGGVTKLVLNLERLQIAGSAALGMLMSLSGELQARGGKLVLVHIEHIEPLLKVTRARTMFTVAPDVDSAAGMF